MRIAIILTLLALLAGCRLLIPPLDAALDKIHELEHALEAVEEAIEDVEKIAGDHDHD